MHKNFLDLTPQYHYLRKQRAKRIADVWLKEFSEKIKESVELRARNIFK